MASGFRSTELGIYSTASEKLKRARTTKDLTLDDCAQATNIQKKYLAALEESHFDLLPGDIYAKSWLRKYAEYLDLDVDDVLISYQKERGIHQKITSEKSQPTHRQSFPLLHFFTARRIALITALLVILSYIGYRAYDTIRPPRIVFNLPTEGFRTQENSIIIMGRTETGAVLNINQQPITLSQNGSFEQEIALREGLNTIIIEAKKKSSRSTEHEIHIVKSPLPTLSATTTGPL